MMSKIEPFEPGATVEVIAKKYDGSVSFRWDATLDRWHRSLCVLSMPKGTPIHSRKRGTYPLSTRAFFYLDREKWFNIAVHADDDDRVLFYYCNVAMPPLIEGAISYVDLELDIQVGADLAFEVLDADEFGNAIEAMKIPTSIQSRAVSALEELKENISARVFPFGFPFGAPPSG